MSDGLLKSWTRVPLIVNRRDGIPFRNPSGCAKTASPALRTSINITKSRLTASLSTGRRPTTCEVQLSGTPFTDFPDMPSSDVRLRPDVGDSPRFKDQDHESKENQRCRDICEDLQIPRCPVSHSRKNDSRQLFARWVVPAALLNRNTSGKTADTLQLEQVEARQSFSAESEPS